MPGLPGEDKRMRQVNSISGQELREMLTTATDWLEKSVSDIDALNVFPVPDGDTGTNMLLTMRSAIEETYQTADSTVSEVVQALARGALMGARGNSGVILSQIWSGLAKSLKDKELISGADLVEALLLASDVAYKGISRRGARRCPCSQGLLSFFCWRQGRGTCGSLAPVGPGRRSYTAGRSGMGLGRRPTRLAHWPAGSGRVCTA